MWILIALIALPLLEIVVFFSIAGEIGLLLALLLCLLAAIAGSAVIQKQGMALLQQGGASFRDGVLPVDDIFKGFCTVAAGVCLIVPGFVTDAIGILLLTPFGQDLLKRVLIRNFDYEIYGGATRTQQDVIDVPYEIVETPDDDADTVKRPDDDRTTDR